jgi:PIN domain nuclease of toxin-antitoxin system
MRLLLDTHIWLWSVGQPQKLSRRVRTEIQKPKNEIWLSPISIWEFLMLLEKGRVQVDGPPEDWISRAYAAAPFREAPLTMEIALATRDNGLAHRDPADNFLVATAKVLQLTLVTSDERLCDAKGVSLLVNDI